MLLNEKYETLKAAYDNLVAGSDESTKKLGKLEAKITELESVNKDLSDKLSAVTEDPDLIVKLKASVETLETERDGLKNQLAELNKSNTELKAEVEIVQDQTEEQASELAAQLIAGASVQPISLGTPERQLDKDELLAKIEEAGGNLKAVKDLISNNKDTWKAILSDRASK